LNYIIIIFLEDDPYISVLEGTDWITKGSFTTATELDEEVTWSQSGGHLLYLCYEKSVSTPLDSGFLPAHFGATLSSTPSVATPSIVSTEPSNLSFKDKIAMVLKVPSELVNHQDKGLKDAWAKYKAYLNAVTKLDDLWNAGQLRNVFDKKPILTDIKNLFKGKTQWHITYHKVFPKLNNYPEMVSWLEDQEDKQSDLDLWGIQKPSYSFSDLQTWLANGGRIESDGTSSEDLVPTKKSKKSVKDKEKKLARKDKGKRKASSSRL